MLNYTLQARAFVIVTLDVYVILKYMEKMYVCMYMYVYMNWVSNMYKLIWFPLLLKNIVTIGYLLIY